MKKTAIALTMALVMSTGYVKAEGNVNDINRLSGKNRYETSEAISKYGWETSEYVIIAQGENFPDALCAAPLAKKYNAPIILTKGDGLTEEGQRELKRLKPSNVILIGGEGVLSPKIEQYIKNNIKGAKIERIGGKNRYETSIKIAEKLGFNGEVAIASSEYYADALSVAPIAAIKGMPIILTDKNTLPKEVKNYLKDKEVDKAYIIGGTGVISKEIGDELDNPHRLSGKDRFDTNVEILKEFEEDLDYSKVVTALGVGPKGNEFADALSGAALAAKYNAPMVLSSKDLPKVTEDYLNTVVNPEGDLLVLGGEGILPNSAVDKIKPSVKVYTEDNANLKNLNEDNSIKITGKNVTLDGGSIKGNLYAYGQNITVSNLNISGALTVNPGKEETINLNNVQTSGIKINSGENKNVNLKGNIKGDVFVKGKANVNINENTTINKLTLDGEVKIESKSQTPVDKVVITSNRSVIKLSGKYKEIEVEDGKRIELAAGTEVEKIVSKSSKGKGVEINIPKDAVVKQISEGFKLEGEGAANVTPGGGAGGAGGGVVPPAQGEIKITGIDISTSNGSKIRGSIDGSSITINVPKNFKGNVTSIKVHFTEEVKELSLTSLNENVSESELNKLSSRKSIDLIELLRIKGYDKENDGIGIDNIGLIHAESIVVKGASGNSSKYTVFIEE
ncbi:cell wall-binding repeat-containing protein [Clostridium sp. MSJ-11]|uniref:Cell wall-binding repeat-containing protein n=1 Tax=Clostridium mobile TaxID=2841512 RepID=A0ABS6EKN2_9CLOT|nr:cell wall-binding repeat-containing protein [Clostridium mobile]MBU5485776.1 cell wall-binding repeat-containing protein [Clostridium mobile]